MTRSHTRGFDALLRKLNDNLGDAKEEIAQMIVDRAQALVPVRTGELRDSIRVDDDGNVTVDAPYAAAVEFGTSRQAAQPFLGPATYDSEPDFEDAIDKAMKETLRGI